MLRGREPRRSNPPKASDDAPKASRRAVLAGGAALAGVGALSAAGNGRRAGEKAYAETSTAPVKAGWIGMTRPRG